MKTIESIKRGFHILEVFSPKRPRLRLGEVTALTDLPKPTVYRILRTMKDMDLVRFDPSTNEFMLGPRLMSLGLTALSGMDLRKTAAPYLETLHRHIDQTVNLGILDGMDVVYIERLKKEKIVNLDLTVGSRLDVYRSSIGHAILAYLDPSDFEKLLAEILRNSEAAAVVGPDGELLLKKLEDVRRKGFAMNDGEYFTDLRAVSAPVFNAQKKVEGAVNIAVFKQQCTKENLLQNIVPRLLDTTASISKAIGFPR